MGSRHGVVRPERIRVLTRSSFQSWRLWSWTIEDLWTIKFPKGMYLSSPSTHKHGRCVWLYHKANTNLSLLLWCVLYFIYLQTSLWLGKMITHFDILSVKKNAGSWCWSHGTDGSAKGCFGNAEEVDSGNTFRIWRWCEEIDCRDVITYVVVSSTKGYKNMMQ